MPDINAPTCLPYDPATSAPAHTLPAGSTDCHCHVFDDPARYPLNPNRSYTPVSATLEDYLTMCRTLGLQRTVQVSASVYGTDNSLTLAVIEALGQHRAKGVAGIALDTPIRQMEQLQKGGICGVRLSTRVKGYGGTEAIEPMVRAIAPFGWHLQLHVADIGEFVALEPMLRRVPVPIVFDHLGCVRGDDGVDHPGFQVLLRLLRERDDVWCKLSSWYRRSDAGPPYLDMKPLVQTLVQTRADRMVFGTNWPHPGLFSPEIIPNDGNLIDQFFDWIPEDTTRRRILVDNPAQLYGFPPL